MGEIIDGIREMEPIVVLGLIAVALAILVVAVSIRFYLEQKNSQQEHIKRVINQHNKLAEGLGLAYELETGFISGSYLGRKVRLWTNSWNNPHRANIEAELSNPPSGSIEVRYVGYEVRREGVYEWAKRFLEARYFPKLEVGDPDFDEVFRIKGTPESFVHGVLGSAHLREQLLDLDTERLWVRENNLFLRRAIRPDHDEDYRWSQLLEYDVDYWSQLLEFACGFAESVENTGT